VGKNKLKRFAEVEALPNVLQPDFNDVFNNTCALKGAWSSFFKNKGDLIVELGCGKGEYTVGLARQNAQNNYIGIDIKGARIWRGAKTAYGEKLQNVVFLRTRVDFIKSVFAPAEVSEIWITFPDPQPKKRQAKNRLTASGFLNIYRQILKPDGIVHLKTDNAPLYRYTKSVLTHNNVTPLVDTDNLYNGAYTDSVLSIKTFYEQKFLAEGLPIHYLKFQLPADIELIEPPDDDQ